MTPEAAPMADRRRAPVVLLWVALMNTIVAMLTAIWLVAIKTNGGWLYLCVDCLGEGLAEVVAMVLLAGVGTWIAAALWMELT